MGAPDTSISHSVWWCLDLPWVSLTLPQLATCQGMNAHFILRVATDRDWAADVRAQSFWLEETNRWGTTRDS